MDIPGNAEALAELERHDEMTTAARAVLLAASAGGLGLGDLAGLFAEMYVRTRGTCPTRTGAGSSRTGR